MRIFQISISLSLLILSLSVAYYLLIYTPEQREINLFLKERDDITNTKNLCQNKYEKWLEETDKQLSKALSYCHVTNICTREQFMQDFKAKNPSGVDPKSYEGKNRFMQNCINNYQPIK